MIPAPPTPVLVTGATGFLGGHVVEALLAQGISPRCLVRPSSDTRWLEGLGVEIRRASLARPSPELSEALTGVRCVVHAAGAVRAMDYAGFLEANAEAAATLAEACLAQTEPPERFVLVSSVGATGPAPRGERLTAQHLPGERTDYGRSKWEGEQRLRAVAGSLHTVIVRPTAIYGPRDRELVPVLRLARAGWLPAFAGPDQTYDLAHVADIAQGIIAAAAAPVASGETFLLGSGEEHSAAALAGILAGVFERPVRLLPLPRALLWSAALGSELWAGLTRRPAMLNRQKIPELTGCWSLDLTPARERLGYAPRWSLAEGLAQTVAWCRAQGSL
ncbi:MAG: NAD-dependent epimerase/dehydratase family protein [Pseudomonadota bacterium]